MRHAKRQSALLLAIACSSAAGLSAQQTDSTLAATLAGLVRDSTGAPIGDVQVGVGRTMLGARTSAAGWFAIEGVPPGEYNVRFQRLGYAGMVFVWYARAGERTEIAIELSAISRSLDTVLVEGKAARYPPGHAEVLGIVVDSAGAPLADAQVQVLGSERVASTGADGQFLFPGLGAGAYLLRIRRMGFAPLTIPVTVGDDGRHTLAIRMSALGLLLDTVEVRAKSGFGKTESAWRDFDARLRWGSGSMGSAILLGDELRKLGKSPLDVALRYSARAVAIGAVPGLTGHPHKGSPTQIPAPDGSIGVRGDDGAISDEGAACILVNGRNAMYWPLRAFHADELEAVEVYSALASQFSGGSHEESELTRSIESRMSSIPACAGSLLGGHPTYYVVWLKGAS